jgi:hypothetical protein
VGSDEADEGNGPRDRGDRPGYEGARAEHEEAHAVDGQAQRRGLLLAEGEHVERAREEEEGDRAGQDEGGGEREVLVAAALEAPREPEEDRADAVLLGGHEQHGRRGGGERAHREPGEQEAGERGPPAGVRDRVDEEESEQGSGARREWHREEALVGPPRVHGDHGAEGGPRAHAEEAGVGERVAEERLQRGADHREPAAHEGGDEDPRESDRPEDHLAHLRERARAAEPGAGEGRAQDAPRGQRHAPQAQRADHRDEEGGRQGGEDDLPPAALAHRSASGGAASGTRAG